MNNVMKQRLVGALILVALGVVFWPIIFVSPESPTGADSLQIPPRPSIDTSPLPAPDDSLLQQLPAPRPAEPISDAELAAAEVFASGRAEAPDAEPAAETAASDAPESQAAAPPAPGKTRSVEPEEFKLDDEGIPIAWSLQVVSVSSRERAEALRDDLIGAGHKAYVKQVRSGGKTLYRISIGPKAEKAKLEAIRSQIDSNYGVKSLVVRYYP